MKDIDIMAHMQTAQPPKAAQAGITEWRRIVAELDWDRLPQLLAENVTYRSPADYEPYQGKETMAAILRVVFGIMEDFTYLRHFSSGTGYVLEFSTRVGDARLSGADFVEFDDDGKITDFMVMMRPADAVQILSSQAATRMAAD
ncbi:nuclear transport factor 2 family protein [Streptomyces sp. NPDC101152]|uniref:nuclear transport factor 2 family protein n=1 Tax=Streptomyces sp. NPDC101152 TaxID=3366116 RepID=UPI003803CB2A